MDLAVAYTLCKVDPCHTLAASEFLIASTIALLGCSVICQRVLHIQKAALSGLYNKMQPTSLRTNIRTKREAKVDQQVPVITASFLKNVERSQKREIPKSSGALAHEVFFRHCVAFPSTVTGKEKMNHWKELEVVADLSTSSKGPPRRGKPMRSSKNAPRRIASHDQSASVYPESMSFNQVATSWVVIARDSASFFSFR